MNGISSLTDDLQRSLSSLLTCEIQGEICSMEEILTRTQPYWHSDLRILGFRNMRNTFLQLYATQSMVLCDSCLSQGVMHGFSVTGSTGGTEVMPSGHCAHQSLNPIF